MTAIIKDGLITVINPITDQIVSTVKCSDLETVNQAIHHAKLYKDWSSLSLKERCGHIKQFRKIIVEHKAGRRSRPSRVAVEHGDDNRHIRAADRHDHMDTEQERDDCHNE